MGFVRHGGWALMDPLAAGALHEPCAKPPPAVVTVPGGSPPLPPPRSPPSVAAAAGIGSSSSSKAVAASLPVPCWTAKRAERGRIGGARAAGCWRRGPLSAPFGAEAAVPVDQGGGGCVLTPDASRTSSQGSRRRGTSSPRSRLRAAVPQRKRRRGRRGRRSGQMSARGVGVVRTPRSSWPC